VTRSQLGRKIVYEAFNIHMRDSAGRLRDEQLGSPSDSQGGFTQTVFIGEIPTSFSNYRQCPIINCARRIVASYAARLTSNPSQSQDVYEDLGERTIEGIRVQGYRITRTFPMKPDSSQPDSGITEIWLHPNFRSTCSIRNTTPTGQNG
jgi:hypothetical protein